MSRIRRICQPELGWDDAHREAKEGDYLALWRESYSLPDRAAIPNWRVMLAEARRRKQAAQPAGQRKIVKRAVVAALLLGLAAAIAYPLLIGQRKRKAL